MMSNEFESAFGAFLEREEYDQAENALFSLTRAAFLAGWVAAGGDKPQPQRMFEVYYGQDEGKNDGTVD